jgi:hypothetical protein
MFADDFYNNQFQLAYSHLYPEQQTPATKAIFAQLEAPSFIPYAVVTSSIFYTIKDESLTQAHLQMNDDITFTFPSNLLVPHDVRSIPAVTLTLGANGIGWCVALTTLDIEQQRPLRLLLLGYDVGEIHTYPQQHHGYTGTYRTLVCQIFKAHQLLRQQT